jgi:hypothetical protein
MTCSTCNRKISGTEIFWQQVLGWEKKREAGGTNHVALRKPIERFMCAGCMTLKQSGIHPGQTSLV